MKPALKIIFIMLVIAAAITARAGEEVKLEAGATLRFEFPGLPDTLETMATGEKQPARLTALLPENYTRDGKFPLCIFLNGGNGDRGDVHGIARSIAGPRDFICVNMPLFKRAYDKNGGKRASLVSEDDFETMSHAYRVMLQKLIEAAPNITPERSALGGFSNGARATAMLLTGQDKFILRHFKSFYFVESGPLAMNVLHESTMKHCRFLLLQGDYSGRMPGIGFLNRAIEDSARAQNLDFTSAVMQNTGHEFPPKYMTIVGQWIRGEKPPELEKK